MALADYRLCDRCEGKAFYDSQLSYDFEEYPDTGLYNLGSWVVVCRDCAETHEARLVERTARLYTRAEVLAFGERVRAECAARAMDLASSGVESSTDTYDIGVYVRAVGVAALLDEEDE